MRDEQAMVRRFHEAFEHPVAHAPAMIDPQRAVARARWLRDEITEFLDAGTLDGQADAIIDLMYFAFGTLVEMGVDGAALFRIVHEANMGKLWSDGRPRFGPDGKVRKPPEWKDPHDALRRELARQIASANGRHWGTVAPPADGGD